MTVSGLVEFLLSRLAEDEAVAKTAAAYPYSITGTPWGKPYEIAADAPDDRADHFLAVDPARVLADVAAKRAIIEMQAANDEDRYLPGFHYKAQMIERVLRQLAQPYAAHPDFDPGWLT